jgi:RNA recognition motif-containing protein
LSNLPYEATESTIRDVFEEQAVPVVRTAQVLDLQQPAWQCQDNLPLLQASVQLLKKGPSGRQRNSGLACITLGRPADVARCCQEMDGAEVLGRPMIVRPDKYEQDDPGYVRPSGSAAADAADVS